MKSEALQPSGDPQSPVCLEDLLAGQDERAAFWYAGRTFSRRQLRDAAHQAAAGLHALGLRRGDALALWLPNGPAWLQLLFAASRLGLLVVPISTRYKAPEVLHLLKVSQARAVVTPGLFLGQDYAAIAAQLSDQLPSLQHRLVLDAPDGFFERSTALGSTGGRPADHPGDGPVVHPVVDCAVVPASQAHGSDLLVCFSTSGTTGAPKLAAHDHRSTPRHAVQVAHGLQISAQDVFLCTLPLFGVFGFMAALAPLSAGALLVLQPVFEAAPAAQAIAEHRVTHFVGSDGMLDSLMALPDVDLSSLRRGALADFSGLIGPVIARADPLGVRFSGTYGMSEVFSLMSFNDWNAPAAERSLAGGRVIHPEIEVRIAEPTTHQEVAVGETGEIQMRGPNVLAQYLNNPEATARAFTPDGWFRSGDLGQRREHGFTYLARMGDSLRLRGYLVNPSEIEAALMADPSIGGAQVVGVQRPGLGDVAVAFVIPAAGIDVAHLPSEADQRARCAERVASYKVPTRILPLGEFPVINGPNGVKIQKRILREWAAQLLETGHVSS
jgi:acyl-CoA synthetase (AMP-forming)/AMP-acid ligase II